MKIAWLYSELLDLYGDRGNMVLLQKRLEQMGIDCTLQQYHLEEEMDFSDCDMVYIGPGKAANLFAAAKDILRHREALLEAYHNNVVFLITGNARALFGKSLISPQGKETECLGFFDYVTQESFQVHAYDAAEKVSFLEEPLVGFVNRTCSIQENNADVFGNMLLGTGDEEQSKTEGNFANRFFGTYLLGPVLVKNPAFAEYLLKLLAGDSFAEYDDNLERQAYELTLRDLKLK